MKNFLRQHQVCRQLGIHVTTWIRWRKAGVAPEPAPVPGVTKWRKSDIDAIEQGEVIPKGRRYFGAAHRAATR